MFEGSAVALVTPFKNNAVDEQKLKELVEFQIAGGTRTIVPCGTTGETSTLSHEEHNRVVELTVKFVNKRARVLAGTGSNATQEAIELTRHAKAVGADGTLQITPYYNKPTQRGLADHFKAIAEAVDLPIVLYNVPGRTGVNMLPSTVVDLVRSCPRVVGIKEASGNIDQSTEIIQALGPVFEVLSGDDSLTLPILAVGGKMVAGWAAPWLPIHRATVGAGMVPRGEVGLIFADVGRSAGLLSAATFNAVLIMVMATTFLGPLLLKLVIPRPKESG